MTNEEAIKEAEVQIGVYENMILYNKDFEPKNDNSNYERKIEFLRIAIEALEEQMHNCEECKHANYYDWCTLGNHLVLCREHNAMMRDDNCCRDWTPLE